MNKTLNFAKNLFAPQYAWIHTILCACMGAFFIFWFYVGLPYNFSMDLVVHDEVLKRLNYGNLIRLALNPLTPAWFFMTEMGYLRPIYYLIVKFFFDFFGANLTPVHVAVALGSALLNLLLFGVTYRITQKIYFAWLVTLLYNSFPTNAVMLAGYLSLDLQFLQSVFILATFYCFIVLTWSTQHARRIWITLGWIFGTWLCIKWKSSEKLLPCIYLFYLILFCRSIYTRIGKKSYYGLVLINLLMFFLVVPLQKNPSAEIDYNKNAASAFEKENTVKDARMFSSNLTNVLSRTFARPGEWHKLAAVISDSSPNTFTQSLGGLLGLAFWSCLLAMPFIDKTIMRRGPPANYVYLRHAASVIGIWFLVTIAAFVSGAPLEEVRYLNFAFVPGMIILAYQIYCIDRLVISKKARLITFTVILTIFLIPIIQNFKYLAKWVGHFGGIQHALVETEMKIHEDRYGKKPDMLSLFLKHEEVETNLVAVSWYGRDLEQEISVKIGRSGTVYLLTRENVAETLTRLAKKGFKFEKLGSYAFSDAKPLMFKTFKYLSGKGLTKLKDRSIILYKLSS